MYVCVCKAVCKKVVEQAIEAGAETREQVTRACSAGGDCGGCHSYIEKMIEARKRDGVIKPCDLVRERAA